MQIINKEASVGGLSRKYCKWNKNVKFLKGNGVRDPVV